MLSSSDEQAITYSRRATTVSLDPSGTYRYEPENRQWSRQLSAVADDAQNLSRSASISLSTSPEGNRLIQRPGTNTYLTTAQASLSALTQTFSHSPPTHQSVSGMASSLKKYSPSSSLTPGWGIFSGSGHGSRSSRPSVHYSESSSHEKDIGNGLRSSASTANIRSLRGDGRLTPDTIGRRSARSMAPSEAWDSTKKVEPGKKKKKKLKSTLRNQDKFDLDSYVSLPLLDPSLEARYKGYRASYAQLLEVWQLYIPRAEVFKIDGIDEDKSSGSGSSPVKRPRRRTLVFDEECASNGLQIRRTCPACTYLLEPIEKNGVAISWQCINAECPSTSRRVSKKSTCAICEKAINGLSVPCLQCEHLTCYDCSQAWFGNKLEVEQRHRKKRRDSKSSIALETIESGEEAVTDDDEDIDAESRSCPTGCGCPCLTVHVDVPVPTNMEGASVSNRTSATIQPQPPLRTMSELSILSQSSLKSQNTADGPFASFLALTRKKSTSAEPATMKTGPLVESSPPKIDIADNGTAANRYGNLKDEEDRDEALLNPWAGSKLASLGRGLGGGLSRGLRERGSDSTIRRVD
jgi:Zinc-ribbon, C4HC2 type